jgi:hypothetical protein
MARERHGEVHLGVAVDVGLDEGLRRRPDITQIAGDMAPFVLADEGPTLFTFC